MYASQHHRLVLEGVRSVWWRLGTEALDLWILSSGYGLIGDREMIVPYEEAEGPLDGALDIPRKTARLVRDYDLAFYLASGAYLDALELPLDVPHTSKQIVLTDEVGLAQVPPAPNLHAVVADGPTAAQRWHVRASQVRGFLFQRLCKQIVQHGPVVLDWLRYEPRDIDELFYKRTPWRPQYPLWKG
jgi:hypothetical protein